MVSRLSHQFFANFWRRWTASTVDVSPVGRRITNAMGRRIKFGVGILRLITLIVVSLYLVSFVSGQTVKVSELPTRAAGALSATNAVWVPIYDTGSPSTLYRSSIETLGTVLGAGTVTNGDKGDITVSSGIWGIDAGVVSLGDIVNISPDVLLGRVTAGSGSIEQLSVAQIRTMLNVEAGADVTDAANVDAAGAVMLSDTSVAGMQFVVDEDNFASNSATKVPTQQSTKAYVDNAIAGLSGVGVSDGDKGDITVSGTGTIWSIDVDAVTYAELQNVSATNRILGRITAGAGNAEELTAANVLSILNVEAGADVTDATNVDAAGAVMNTDTSTALMQFVIDEDNFASNSATKVPTQQSVKAYVDANSGGGAADSFTNATDGDATPDVTNVTVLRTVNTTPTTITNFDNGATAQRIVVHVTDANTTLDNNSSIVLHGAADRVAQTGGYVVVLRYNGTVWREEGIGSSFQASAGVINDGSDNLTVNNAISNKALTIASTGASSTVNLAVNNTSRVVVDNTSIDLVGTIENNGTPLIIDEDSMATNSAVRVPSQQSVKAYVDANSGGGGSGGGEPTLLYSGKNIWPGLNYAVANTTQDLTANRIYLFPVYVGTAFTFTAFRFEVTTTHASTAKCVLYDSTSGGWPDAKIAEGAEVSISTSGIKTDTIGSPVALTAGKYYWIGISAGGGTMRATSTPITINAGLGGSSVSTCITRDSVPPTAAFPASWVFVTSEFNGGAPPACLVAQ